MHGCTMLFDDERGMIANYATYTHALAVTGGVEDKKVTPSSKAISVHLAIVQDESGVTFYLHGQGSS